MGMHATSGRGTTRSGRRWATAVAGLGLLLAGAGCSAANPAVVAYVGSAEITQRQVDEAVAAVQTTVSGEQRVSTPAVVNVMIHGELAAQIATEKKIAITDATREAAVKATNLAPLLAVPEAKPLVYDYADQAIVAQRLGPEGYLGEVGKRQVKLNPRYGVLDPQRKLIVEGGSGSLSTPAPAAPTP